MTKSSKRRRATICVPQPLPTTFLIEFVLDETGSMSSCKGATVGGFNDYIDEQRAVPGQCKMSLTKFQGGDLHTPYENLDLGFVPPMTDRMFVPGGMTNLFDAIGDRITTLAKSLETWAEQPNVLFIVMTDGGDNASRSHNAASIARLVGQYRERGWGFAYLGANQNAVTVGTQMGFLPTECRTFETAEMRETMRDLSTGTTVYRTAVASGVATEIFR